MVSLAFVALKSSSFYLFVTGPFLVLQLQTPCPSFFHQAMLVYTSLISHQRALSAQKTGFWEFQESMRSGGGL